MRTFTQKLAFLLLALFCVVGVQLKADEVVVGDSTSTSSYLPAYPYYNYSYTQQIYTAEEIGVTSGSINSITMWMKGSSSIPTMELEVYMKEVDRDRFSSNTDWETFSASDLVYSGSVDVNNTTMQPFTLSLESAFNYEGGNLLIAVVNAISGTYSQGLAGKAFTAEDGADRALYVYNDYNAYSATTAPTSGNKTAVRDVIMFDITSSGSGPACNAPSAVEITGVTSNSAVVNITGEGGPYIILYKKSTVSSWDDAEKVSGVNTASYELTGLESNTAYNVKVSRTCGDATSNGKTANFTTAIALPYLEPFATSSAPSGWNKHTATLNADGSATLGTASGSYHWSFGASQGVFDSHASIEVYSSQNQWLVSPQIPMQENLQLTFDLALTYWSGSDVPCASRASQPDARFVVLISADGNNWVTLREWNNTGSEYVFDNIECSATGEEVEIDLSSYSTGTYQFAFYVYHSSGGDNRIHVDNFKIAAIPSCLKPEGLVETAVTKNSISVDWTPKSGETEWKVQYKKAADEDYTTIDNVAEHPYTISGLEAYTNYNIRVAAVCADETTDYGKVITVKTAAGVPFEQSFNASSIPSDWKRFNGSWEEVENGEALEAVSTGWTYQYKTTNGVFPDSSYHLVLNLKDTVYKWIVSPAIEMEAGYQLTFNLALTKASGSLLPVDPGKQNSQKFYVAVSEDGGASWSTLDTWTSEGAKFDGINASASGQVAKINLSAFAGKRINLAFYGESQKDPDDANETGDNNLHIQNFKIATIPNCENSGTLDVTAIAGTTASLQWDNEEGATWQYFYRAKGAEAYTPQETDWVNSTSDYFVALTGLSETTSYVFYLRRHCGDDNNSEARSIEFTTIQTPAAIPFTDNFEASNKWVLINGTQTNAWAWGSATQKDGAKSLYISNDGGTSYAYTGGGYYGDPTYAYAAKSFYFEEAGVYSFSFDWKAFGSTSGSSYSCLRVLLAPLSAELVAGELYDGLNLSTIPAGWLALDGGTALYGQSDWQHVSNELNVEEAGNYKVVLFWYDYYYTGTNPAAIDNFSISKVNCSMPSGLTLDGEPTANSAAFAWDDLTDGNTWAYAYALATAAEPAEFTDIDDNSVNVEGLTENSNYIFYLRKNCGANGYSESIQLPFKTLNPYQITINEGTTTNSYVPIHGLYTDDHTRSQFIIPAATLDAIAWDTITNLTFFASSASISWEDHDWEIYMAEVPNTTFSSTSYVAWSGLTKVKNAGTLAVNADKEMVVALDAPFQYKGGNLLIGFYQTTTDETYTSCSWYGVSATGASLSSYSTTQGADGSPSQRNFLPKMAIDFKKGQAPACAAPKGLTAVADSLKADSAFVKWTEQGTASTWILRYRKSGVEKWDSLTVNVDSLWLENLTPATTYEAQVAAWCDPTDEETITDFTGSIEFTTECVKWSIADKGAYTEGFEAYEGTTYSANGVAPTCWNVAAAADVKPHVITSENSNSYAYVHSGTKALTFYGSGNCFAALPEFEEELNTLKMSFWTRMENASNGTLTLGYITDADAGDFSTFHALVSYPGVTTITQYKAKLDTIPAEAHRLAFRWNYSSQYSCCIDDILVEKIPDCQEPENLAIAAGVDSITTTTARLAWTALNGETEWTIQYRKASETAWSSVVANTNPFELTGLTPSSIYYARVAAACTSENSAYSDSISFITECAAISAAELPYSQNFDEVSGLPLCWTKINTTTATYYQSYPYVSGKELYFYSYYNSDPQDQYAILPEMENINTLRIKFDARKNSSYNADFFIGVMSDPADTATFVVIDSIKPASSIAASYEVKLSKALASAKHIAIKMAKATSSYRSVYIDNVVVEEVPPCLEPNGAISVKDITDAGATLFWDNEEDTSWKWAIALASAEEPADDAFEAVSDTFKVFDNLSENSAYIFYLRRACESLMSPSILKSFTTKMTPADPTAFSDDFEGAISWQFINGDLTNAWVIDTAAHKDGEKALYVSKDGGKHNAYDKTKNAMVYATKLFEFEETGTYQVDFDWLAGGESSSDYLRVALIPDSIVLAAATSAPSGFSGSALPQAWNAKAIDGGSKLNLKTSWQHSSTEVLVENTGLYKVVFAWINDGSVGNDTAATVDNFSIEKLSCVRPSALAAKLTEGNGSIATLSWKKGDQETAWVVNYSLKADLSDSIEVAATDTSVNLTGLQSDSTYYARVLSVCGDTRTKWSEIISFTPTNAVTLTINDSTATNTLVPIASTYLYQYYYEEGAKSQFIIPADSLTDVQWGKIKQLTFYSTTASQSFGNATFEVYMAQAPAATFASDAFVTWTSMEKVMSEASLAVEGNKMVVTLDEPYDYVGGNLMIGIKSIASGYVSSSVYWQGIVATNAAVASEYEYDYWEDEYSASPARQNFSPKMTIQYNPGEEPSCVKPTGLTVAYNGGDSAVVNWTSEAASWNIDVNGAVTAVDAKPYTIHGLSLATAYAVKVQAVCGQDNLSEWTSAQNFATDICNAEDQQSISYTLSDSYGDGWNGGATLKVVHKATSKEIAAITLSSGSSRNGTLPLCCGEEYSLVWVKGSYDSECSFVIKDIDGATILSKSNPSAGLLDSFTMVCPSCFKPTAVAIPDSTITATTAVVHWTAGHSSQTEWQIAYDTLTSNQPDTLPSFRSVTAIPDTLKELLPDHTYFVYVRAYCGPNDSSKWAGVQSFTTASLCQKPSGVALVNAGLHSATISWNTYGQTGFNLRYGTDGVNWTTVNDIETSPYTIESGLNASTSYQVQVQAACAADQENSWTSSFTFKTAYGIPFEEKFDATTTPTDWSILSGLAADALNGTAPTATTGWWQFETANGVFNNHARFNLYYTGRQHWLVTPQVEVEGDAQLTFDLALTAYSGTTKAPDTTGVDDKFIVLISEDNGANWSVLRQWDNAGSEYVLNDIDSTAAGEQVAISLASYNGKAIKIAFYAESTEANTDNNLHIDNVLIDLVPTCLKPTKPAAKDVFAHQATISWTAGEEGQDAWQIAYDTIATNKPDTLPNIIDVTENPYVLNGLEAAHTYYVYVRANCGDVDGKSKWTDAISFTTSIACPAPTALKANLTPGNGSIATLEWIAGGNETNWVLEYSLNADMSDSIEVLATDTSVNLTGLTAESKYYARVKADCGDLDGKSLYSAIISFTPTNKFELTVNDGTITNTYVPFYGYDVDGGNTRSQFIIPAADLASIEWDSIKSLTFYGAYTNSSRTTWGDAKFKVYVAAAEEATLSAVADWSAMDVAVAEASVALVDGKMVVTFDAPYQYQGGNLMIGFYQTATGSWASCNWYGVTATGASMAGSGTSISQRNFLPKMTIEYVEGVEPACLAPKGLKVVETAVTKATLAWKAVEGAAWEYAVVRKNVDEAPQYIPTDKDTAVVEGLLPQTDYIFYLRRNCGENGNSEALSVEFTTDAFVAAVPFSDDFEGYNNWKFVNDEVNGWVVGEAINKSGSQSLYISNDGGATHAYDYEAQTTSFATLLINLTEDTTYVVEYDWMSDGEYYEEDGALDYLRVGIVPATSAITAGSASLPAGWIALDGDTTLTEQAEWAHMKQEVALNAGQYKIVVAWFNDDADGSTPAAIDNFSIKIKSNETPTSVEGIYGDSAKAIKFIHNDKVFILVNGVIYNITGQRVELK